MRVQRELERLDRNDDGAVLMLGLAGALVIFMTGLLLYDAGYMATQNIDDQMAADTAAYSQASVKARTMNAIAFANVGKRTVVGMRNMYYGNFLEYEDWLEGEKSACQNCENECTDEDDPGEDNCPWDPFDDCEPDPGETQNGTEDDHCPGAPDHFYDQDYCHNYWGNGVHREIASEERDDQFDDVEDMDTNITSYIQGLDGYQSQMKDYAAYWGYAEAITRGAHNDADWIGTFPNPMPGTGDTGVGLPVQRSSDQQESCLQPHKYGKDVGDRVAKGPITESTVAEWKANESAMVSKSAEAPENNANDYHNMGWSGSGGSDKGEDDAEKGPEDKINRTYARKGCEEMEPGGELSMSAQAPYFLTVGGMPRQGMLEKSNFIFAFQANDALDGQLRDKYKFTESWDYAKTQTNRPVNGTWAMARGEIYFPPDRRPDREYNATGNAEIWMFHPGWMGKNRPVTTAGESPPVEPRKMWTEIDKTFNASYLSGMGVSGVDISAEKEFMYDAMRGLTGTAGGSHVSDGLSK